MNRIEIEIELHRGRADALEWLASLTDEELARRAPGASMIPTRGGRTPTTSSTRR